MKRQILTILLIFSINVRAEDPVLLLEGKPAPFTGLLFSTDKANDIKIQLIERDTFKLMNLSYEKSMLLMTNNIKLKDEQLDIVLNQNNKLASQLRDQKDFNSLERFAWFALGVLGTSLAVYGVQKATNR